MYYKNVSSSFCLILVQFPQILFNDTRLRYINVQRKSVKDLQKTWRIAQDHFKKNIKGKLEAKHKEMRGDSSLLHGTVQFKVLFKVLICQLAMRSTVSPVK